MGSSFFSVRLVSVAVIAYDLFNFQRNITTDLQSVADIAANHTVGAVVLGVLGLGVESDAESTLNSLEVNKYIHSATIILPDGDVFASYTNEALAEEAARESDTPLLQTVESKLEQNDEVHGMSDIDKFKHINDTYGHPAGDAVLKEVAKRVNDCLREYDSVGRFGGEEFLFVIAEIEANAIRGLAERVRHAVCDTTIPIPNSEITVTMSFGIAVLNSGNIANKEMLIQMADKALYHAKETGRNRVEMAAAAEA